MDIRDAYNSWALQYDSNNNKTRDVEAAALRTCLANLFFDTCLEIGCGTGKNTAWFVEKAKHVIAIDLSEEMLAKAKEKITSEKVQFTQANILEEWTFANTLYDLISFSLVLEHIEDLDAIFYKSSEALVTGGHVYLGELHPFKQYAGTKARFDTEEGTQVVNCFNHHLSDFTRAAKKHGLELVDVDEYFDNGDRNTIPRILTVLLRKA